MPRPNPPPTPGSSTDIRGKEANYSAPAINLPPTAFPEPDGAQSTPSTPSAHGSDSSYRPVSPTSPTALSRKRTASQTNGSGSGKVITKDDFSLPPPPTRSRKIIQMQQPAQSEHAASEASSIANGTATAAPSKGGARKKQGNGPTAAGRKIARKTAHSLIERRRRSKMNEEFGVLKDMIPACKGQDMHKLAILQAGIDYLRYLEQCVSDLQVQKHNSKASPEAGAPSAAPTHNVTNDDSDEEMSEADDAKDNANDDIDSDADDGTSTPHTAPLEKSSSLISLPSLSHLTSTLPPASSPSTFSTTAGSSYSISSSSQPSYSPYIHSAHASPAFGPQLHHAHTVASGQGAAGSSGSMFTNLTSPALKPLDSSSSASYALHSGASGPASSASVDATQTRRQQELDQEATAALLMLNHDRRSWRPAEGRAGSGMSVRDLLTG